MRIYLLLIITLLISSCSLTQKKPPYDPVDKPDLALEHFVNWKIHGRISIKTPEDTNIVSIRWQQNQDDIHLRLYGSLGKTYARLVKTNGLATLTVENKTYTNSNARYLLWSVLGWDLPIEEMQYWIKGIPHKKKLEQQIKRNDAGQLISFSYKNWTAEYAKYRNFENYQLPTKLVLTHPKLRIRFSIQSWKASE